MLKLQARKQPEGLATIKALSEAGGMLAGFLALVFLVPVGAATGANLSMMQHLFDRLLGMEPQQFIVGVLAIAALVSHAPAKE